MPWDNNRPTHVPTRIRDACLQRDGYRCTAIMHNGTRCTETTNLEAAHNQGWHQNERLTVDMLHTACHWHHNRETQTEAAQARQQLANRRPSAFHPREKHPGRT
jgi:hypothetical protein